eukprot:TRINITY_DN5494_c0_g1_i1.p1 TRINITY_DN5494_c0_g1~~TRINITY_DN5494_c0_g1_i1.p1  ORF type:complete len:242 (+),score=64.94 TRINITY_DN5494_c0_g1_i1:89-727(+)
MQDERLHHHSHLQKQAQIQSNAQALLQKMYDQFSWFLYKLEELERQEQNHPPSVVQPRDKFPPAENRQHLLNQIRGLTMTMGIQIDATAEESKEIRLKDELARLEHDFYEWLAGRAYRPIDDVDIVAFNMFKMLHRQEVEDYRPVQQELQPNALLGGFVNFVDGTQKTNELNAQFEKDPKLEAIRIPTSRGPLLAGQERLREIIHTLERDLK